MYSVKDYNRWLNNESENRFVLYICVYGRESNIYPRPTKKRANRRVQKYLCLYYSLYTPLVQYVLKIKPAVWRAWLYQNVIGGKQSPPASGQQLNPCSPISVYISPGQHPYSSGATPPSQVMTAVVAASSSVAVSINGF